MCGTTKSSRKDQRKNLMEPDDTVAAAALARESAPDTVETGEATEEPDPKIATTEQIESLLLS